MIREFCMFAGYGGSVFALKKANIPHELVGFSEIDKYAIQCFIQNHITNNSHLLHMEVVNGGLDIAIAVPKNWGDER